MCDGESAGVMRLLEVVSMFPTSISGLDPIHLHGAIPHNRKADF